ncbi:general secretion pathway protein GspD [Polaribacter sp.]|nr:general secretion pathway protein GspD [Polaribacter sp.]
MSVLQKYNLQIVLLLFLSSALYSQTTIDRIQQLEITLDRLSDSIKGLNNKVDFNVKESELTTLLRSIAKTNKINLSIATNLKQIKVTQNFANATVKNVLLYVCKQHQLTIDVLGTILSVKRYVIPFQTRTIEATYHKEKDLFSIHLQNDTLHTAFKKITDVTGKNLVFAPGIENQKITAYIKEKSFESAIDKIAFANNLSVTKTKDNYYLFESASSPNEKGITDTRRQKPARYRNSNFYFKVQDTVKQIVDIDFENVSIASIIKDIGFDLNINMFTSTPLESAGNATVKATNITFDQLLKSILENTKWSFKKKNNIYFFGDEKQTSLGTTTSIPLLHRSIEIMNNSGGSSRNTGFQDNGGNFSNNTNNNNQFNQNQGNTQNTNNSNRRSRSTNRNSFQDYSNNTEALLDLIPKSIKEGIDIAVDIEQNAFIVDGNAQKIEAFKAFLKTIDKPVPVILIEVMIIEVSNSNSISVGLDLGLGESPTEDKGAIFQGTNLTLGASSINKIIGGFNGFGSLNVGKVTENFYAKIEALETNGDLKIHSTPKLSTLNGHQATLSRGQRSYYAVTQTNTIGTQNPLISNIKNYLPIDADLSIGIRPLVSGDGNITLKINVLQSSFNGERIDPDAPPGMDSREFTSTIRVKDKDVIILGGIEETSKNSSGSGVPFLARIPLIKYFFSKRTRTASKSKLSVLIKPTIIR